MAYLKAIAQAEALLWYKDTKNRQDDFDKSIHLANSFQ